MIPFSQFNCPHCGAPGQVSNGAAEYSCNCRFNNSLGNSTVMIGTCNLCGGNLLAGHSCNQVRVEISSESQVAIQKIAESVNTKLSKSVGLTTEHHFLLGVIQ